MKFRFVKEVPEPVKNYGGELITTGDVVELTGHLAEKAKTNPNYELVRGPGRPKNGDQG